MKKNLLAIGVLVFSYQANAQIATYVEDGANVFVGQDALVYSTGGLRVVASGKVENFGNIQITAGELLTIHTSTAPKKNGNNIILKLNDLNGFSRYGQLWIDEPAQTAVTGIVDKEYRDKSHGKYQQLALPFYKKILRDLNNEIPGIGLTNTRFVERKASGKNVLVYNNREVVEDLHLLENPTNDPTAYYIIGTKDLAANYFPTNTTVIKGVPITNGSGISVTMQGAGAGMDFGKDGEGVNKYQQRFYTYLYDAWDASTNDWTGDYGKNIYQYGNPFFTNLDLTLLPDNVKANIKGIRYEVQGANTNLTEVVTGKYISFTNTGVPTGDLTAAIVKPMQEIAIKLKSNVGPTTINFSNLRTFNYTASNNNYKLENLNRNVNRSLNNYSQNSTTGSVKQLEVIALNADKQEIDRTYYVVYPSANTGHQNEYSAQVTALDNIIGTFEEKADGDIDPEFADTYWLYINEANENNFKGKKVALGLYSDKIAYLQFVVRENTNAIQNNTSKLSNGESFYVNLGGDNVQIHQGQTIAVPANVIDKSIAGLYYGTPEGSTLNTKSVDKPSSTTIVMDNADNTYKVIFDTTWKKAKVEIFDLSGKLISSKNDINTTQLHTLDLPSKTNAVYVVVATSETGKKYVQKVKTFSTK